jgi:phosphinothricin acetyltransferase
LLGSGTLPLDSESRWRLVRKLKAREAEKVASVDEITIRAVALSDMKQIAEIYNYYVTNSVVTFDIEPTTENTFHNFHKGCAMHLLVLLEELAHLQPVQFFYLFWAGYLLF